MARSVPRLVDAQPNVPLSGARIRCAALDGVQLEFPDSDTRKWLSIATLVDIIQSVGIKKGGNFPCSLIYILNEGGYVRLVREGGTEHQNAVDKDELRQMAPIKNRDLKVGGVYRSLSGWGLFLGHVHTKPIDIHWPLIKDKSPVRDRMLWCVLIGPERPPIEALTRATTLDDQFNVLDDNGVVLKNVCTTGFKPPSGVQGYCFEVKDSHQYRKLLARAALTAEQAVGMLTEWVITRLESESDISYWFKLAPILAITTSGRPRMPVRLQQALSKLKYTYVGEDTPLNNFPELLTHSNEEVRRYAKGMFARLKGGELNRSS